MSTWVGSDAGAGEQHDAHAARDALEQVLVAVRDVAGEREQLAGQELVLLASDDDREMALEQREELTRARAKAAARVARVNPGHVDLGRVRRRRWRAARRSRRARCP